MPKKVGGGTHIAVSHQSVRKLGDKYNKNFTAIMIGSVKSQKPEIIILQKELM